MRFKNYFLELQFRFFILFSHFIFLASLFYFYKLEILKSMIDLFDADDLSFHWRHLTNILSIYIILSSSFAAYFSYPLFVIQLSLFLNPALYKYESKLLKIYCLKSILLFFFSNWVTYYYIIPFCWKLFSDFQIEDFLELDPGLDEFFYFYIKFLLGSQLFCQSLLFISSILTYSLPSFYKVSRKIVYFLFLLISTLITPPDFYSQIFLTIFLMLFYECFVISFFLTKNYKNKRVNNGS